MKKNLVVRIAAIVLMCTLVTACFASSTFARYTSGTTASSANYTIATWNVTLNGSAFTDTMSFNLYDTLLDSDGTSAEKNATTIAPGTSGMFDFEVANASQVDADATIEITIPKGFPSAIVFTYDGKEYTGSATADTKITITQKLKGTGTSDENYVETSFNPEITWKWAYTDTNENSLAGSTLPTITAKINVVQAD